MKTLAGLLLSILLLVFSWMIISSFAKGVKRQNILADNLAVFKDSVGKLKMEQMYLSDLVKLEMDENAETVDLDTVKVYTLTDREAVLKGTLKPVLTAGKNKLVVRYTEIGCNACTDKTIQLIKADEELAKKYDILFLVDFSSYDAYIKWRKLSEVTYPVLWVKKGDLPFRVENDGKSYLFTISHNQIARDFFFPNSLFPGYIHNYLQAVEKKVLNAY